jgi:cytochrome c peroxidase
MASSTLRTRFRGAHRYATASAVLLTCTLASSPALTQLGGDDVANGAAQRGAIAHAQGMRVFQDFENAAQAAPPIIARLETDIDPAGVIATLNVNGPTPTAGNPFFQNLGTNDRTCFTCHQPQTGWTVSAQSVQARFASSFGTDPIFRLVDGATCPSDDVSSLAAKRQAYRLLLSRGLIRIGLPIPAGPEFEIITVDDPYGCNTDPATGLTSSTTGTVSAYRRPLPATNLGFLSTIMWDGRESSLSDQARDATLGHAQADAAPSDEERQQIVDFETGLFTTQLFDNNAGFLNAAGANGGPAALQEQLGDFFIGVNDPFGQNPTPAPFTSEIFDLYDAWSGLKGKDDVSGSRAAVARGESLFNNTQIEIRGVAGINDVLLQESVAGFCGTCHDTPNVGNHSVKAPLDIGIADAGALSPPALDISGLPVFTLRCVAGPFAGRSYVVTDPGRALISGKCADIGKLKGPILRGLAARAPYFHNGSAATLMDVVNFYDERFHLNFSEQDKSDLVAFLSSL